MKNDGVMPNYVHGRHAREDVALQNDTVDKKRWRMDALAARRKLDRSRTPPNFLIGDFHGGVYDCGDFVSPWSISAHNLSAEVMIFLQDWTSYDAISKGFTPEAVELGYSPHLPTNKNLIMLLRETFNLELYDTYITNLFVFVKPGKMNSRIPSADLDYCAVNYALPQIEIVKPKMVICVGSLTYNTLRVALGQKRVRLTSAIEEPLVEYMGAKIFGVSHTGALGVAGAGGISALSSQWHFLNSLYRTMISEDNP